MTQSTTDLLDRTVLLDHTVSDTSRGLRIGVLALQGAFAKHLEMVDACDGDAVAFEVRTPAQLRDVDALIVPGGESSTMSKLLDINRLRQPILSRLAEGMPLFGTCAGLILAANEVLDGRADQESLAALDIVVRRNGYGRQIDSFETDLDIAGLQDGSQNQFRAVFIRAPKVEGIGEGVEVLASVDGTPVLVRSGTRLGASFHPELTNDPRLHQLFLDGITLPSA